MCLTCKRLVQFPVPPVGTGQKQPSEADAYINELLKSRLMLCFLFVIINDNIPLLSKYVCGKTVFPHHIAGERGSFRPSSNTPSGCRGLFCAPR